MFLDLIPYIIAAMIFWDFSLHIIELLNLTPKFTRSKSIFSYYFPHFRWKKSPNGPVERENWRKLYNRFWTAYWGTALVLILIYLIAKV